MAEPPPPRRFGPSALATPANAVTLARVLVAPVLVALVAAFGPDWAAFVLSLVLFSTDGVDGWVARRHGTTSSGAFLDPLADKIVVLGALYALVGRGEISWIPVSLIALREVMMSFYRSIVGRRGVSIPARRSAKLKTAVQDLSVVLLLVPPLTHHHLAPVVVLWVAAGLTLVSGVQYLVDGLAASSRLRSTTGGVLRKRAGTDTSDIPDASSSSADRLAGS